MLWGGKRERAEKKLLKERDRYSRLIAEHDSKILENLKLGKRLESIRKMEREIKLFQREIAKINRLLGGKKKRKK